MVIPPTAPAKTESSSKSLSPSALDIPIPQTPFKPTQPKLPFKHYFFQFLKQPKILVIVGLIVILTILVSFSSYLPRSTPSIFTNISSIPTNVITATPTINPNLTPTLIANPTYLPMNWAIYRSGNEVNSFAFSFTFPFGWKVNFRNDPYILNPVPHLIAKIDLDFLPPGATPIPEAKDWLGWGEMTVTVYKRSDSPEDWIKKTFPPEQDKLAAFPDGSIGNRPTYLIAPRKDVPSEDKIFSYFAPRNIVVTSNYVYEFGFSQNGRGDFMQTIKRGIWPFFKFE